MICHESYCFDVVAQDSLCIFSFFKMQAQTLHTESASAVDLRNVDINIGVIAPLTSPYNLFLNVGQLTDPESEVVYFFVYSIGKKRVVLWGVYLKSTEEFTIESGCKYAVKDLSEYLKTWKRRDYSYVANSVYDRVTNVMVKELGAERWQYSEYLRYKFILAYYEGRISESELRLRYPDEPGEYLNELYKKHDLNELIDGEEEINEALDDELVSLKKKLKEYEASINRTDVSTVIKVSPEVRNRIKYVTDLFYQAIKLGYYTEGSYYRGLESCPSVHTCATNYNAAGCEVVYYGDEELGMLSSRDLAMLQ